jgi:GNAT superfamily N-acetyltransferase
MIRLETYHPNREGELLTFWNAAFAGQRNFRPLTAPEWQQRVIAAPAFDPRGLILAVDEDGAVVGGVHALRPAPPEGVYQLYNERHHIAWLMVAHAWRGQGIGRRLLQAAESYLYYCPVSFATETTPIYGSVEGPRPPLFGSSQRMGLSLRTDRSLIDWLARRGYHVVEPGDVSLALRLDAPIQPPAEPDWNALRLRPVFVSHLKPWTGPGYDELRLWGDNGGWPYAGVVLADLSGAAVARIVWIVNVGSNDLSRSSPAPQALEIAATTEGVAGAAIIRLDVQPAWQGRALGSYLLDRALAGIAAAGHVRVEVQTHVAKHARAHAMYTRRGFILQDAWASLVKT